MFLREVVTGQKTGQPVRYAQIVESYRDEGGKSRHRVLLSLGRVDRLDKDRIQQLVTALCRYLDTGQLPPGARVGEVRDFGLLFVLDAVWASLGLPAAITRLLKKRRFEIGVERALFAMVAHRLCDPGSKRACADWLANDAWLPASRTLTVHQLYRAMDFLEAAHEDLERAIYLQRRTLFDRAQVVYLDTTSTYFELDEAGGSDVDYGLRQRGYSRDEKPDRRQIVVALATDQNGLPLLSEVFSGDTHDALTVVPILERVKALGLTNVVWISDRGLTSDDNLAALRDAKPPLDYVVGVKLRAHPELREAMLADTTPYAHASDELQAKDVRVGDRRYVVCFSAASAERDLALRLQAIERVKRVLDEVNGAGDSCDITRNGWYARLCSKHEGRWALDKSKLDREAACDGVFVLEVSRASMSASEAALAYKGLLRVEQCFDALKHTIDLRPVFHRLDRRIRAHVTLCTLALLLERVMEHECKRSFEPMRRELQRMRAVQLHLDGQTIWESSRVTPGARAVLTALRVSAPPRVLVAPSA